MIEFPENAEYIYFLKKSQIFSGIQTPSHLLGTISSFSGSIESMQLPAHSLERGRSVREVRLHSSNYHRMHREGSIFILDRFILWEIATHTDTHRQTNTHTHTHTNTYYYYYYYYYYYLAGCTMFPHLPAPI